MRNCRLDRRWPQVYGLKPVDPEQLMVTLKREPPPPSIPHHCLSKNKMNSCSDSAMRSTSVVSAFSFMRRIPYTGPNIPGYWSLVIKVYKKGGSTTKRLWFSELSPQFRRGNKFKSPQEVVIKKKQGSRRCLGGEVGGLEGCEGVGGLRVTGSPEGLWWWWWWCNHSDFQLYSMSHGCRGRVTPSELLIFHLYAKLS